MHEFEAAAYFGLIPDVTLTAPNNWFELPRETRATMAAYVRLKNLGDALTGSDTQDWYKAEAERERKRKGKGGK